MDENYQAETIEATDFTEGTPEVNLDAFDDGWDGDGQTDYVKDDNADMDEADGEAQEADQQTESDAVDNKQADEAADPDNGMAQAQEQTEKGADQLFTLKHLDETHNVDRETVVSLAQKGLDYDRKVGKLNSELAEYKGFFEELAANSGLSRDQFMDSVRAKMLIAEENRAGRQISESDAIFRVQKARADKIQAEAAQAAEQAQKAKAAEQQRSNEAIKAFRDAYPNVKVEDIPKSVWDEMPRTGDLLGAYTRYLTAKTAKENEDLKKQIAALQNNAKNASRSIGSKKTAGSAKAMDDFDAGWDSI